MSLPHGWTPVELSADRGLPQSAPLTGPGAPLRLVLAGVAPDLAALLSAPADRAVWSTTAAPAVEPVWPPETTWPSAANAAAAALTRPPGDSLSPAGILVTLLVVSAGSVVTAWPPIRARALAVRDATGLLGHLWVDELVVTAGSLVSGGPSGGRVSVGWRPLGTNDVITTGGRPSSVRPEEDPYAGLV